MTNPGPMDYGCHVVICVLAAAAATPTIARWELPALAHRDPTVSHDLDGDGKDDGWTTNYSYLGVGIYVGGELLQLRQTFPSRTFGDDITWAGDVDGDGHPDLVLDAPGSQDGTISGSLWVIRGGPDMTVDGVWVAPGHVEFADRGSLESFTMALPGKWAGWRWPAGTLVDDGYVTIRGRVRTCGVTLEGTRDHPIRVRHGPVNGSIAFEIHAPAEIAGHRYRPDVVFLRCVDGQPVVDLGRLDEPATVFGAPLQPGDKFHFHGAEGRESKLDVTFGAPRDVGGVLASEATWLDGRLLSARVLPGEYTVGNWEKIGRAHV